jgi:predicted RNase H-like nuclease (RuvC/YqgF family)
MTKLELLQQLEDLKNEIDSKEADISQLESDKQELNDIIEMLITKCDEISTKYLEATRVDRAFYMLDRNDVADFQFNLVELASRVEYIAESRF